jgi:hypothetical protein
MAHCSAAWPSAVSSTLRYVDAFHDGRAGKEGLQRALHIREVVETD